MDVHFNMTEYHEFNNSPSNLVSSHNTKAVIFAFRWADLFLAL